MQIHESAVPSRASVPASALRESQLGRVAVGPGAGRLGALQLAVDSSPRILSQQDALKASFGSALQRRPDARQGGGVADCTVAQLESRAGVIDGVPAAAAHNETGMPDRLKSRIEALSGLDLSTVRVHRNSDKPAQLNALAYAQGDDIHVAPGQESHLPHEAWHVVQQRQGRVKATMQMAGVTVNDDPGLEREADVMGGKAEGEAVQFVEGSQTQAHFAATGPESGRRVPAWAPGAGPTSRQSPAQRRDGDVAASGVVQRDTWDATQHLAELGLQNQQNLRNDPGRPAGAHPVHIGADPDPANLAQTAGVQRHIDDDMLATLTTVLDSLPASHINGNPALARIVLEHANGQVASSFNVNGTLTLIVPFDTASWVYLNITKWPLGDLATTLGSTQHPRGTLRRDVVGTGSNLSKVGMVPQKFVEWMIRHEVGHSVDHAIGWLAKKHYRQVACGAWEIHPAAGPMVDTILTAVGIAAPEQVHLDNAFGPHTAGTGYRSMVNAFNGADSDLLRPAFRDAAVATFDGLVGGGARMLDYAESVIHRGLQSPYENGGGVRLANRTYQHDPQQGEWVSYQSSKYDLRDSNYQFQSPGEWFAETYSRYFIPPQGQWGRKVNDPAARQWFLHNLDPVNNAPAALFPLGNLVPLPLGAGVAPVQNAAPPPGHLDTALSSLISVGITIGTLPISLVMRTVGAAVGTAQLGKIGLQAAYRAISNLF